MRWRLPNWKQHKVEIILAVFGVGLLMYLHKRHLVFYGEGTEIMAMPMDMGMKKMGGGGGGGTSLTSLCADMPTMDMKKFENCINAGVDVAQCAACFGGGNKAQGGIVDTLNFENCLNEGKTAADCIKRSTFGQGRAGVKAMM